MNKRWRRVSNRTLKEVLRSHTQFSQDSQKKKSNMGELILEEGNTKVTRQESELRGNEWAFVEMIPFEREKKKNVKRQPQRTFLL